MNTPGHVVLVGSMGSGKTTIGSLVADALGRELVDSDRVLAHEGENAADLARALGVAALHERECRQLRQALAMPVAAVVAAAASTIEASECRAALVGHTVVWLRVDPELAAARLASGDHRRDLGDHPLAAMRELAARRDPLFEAAAEVVVDVGDRGPDEAARAVVAGIGRLDADAPPTRA